MIQHEIEEQMRELGLPVPAQPRVAVDPDDQLEDAVARLRIQRQAKRIVDAEERGGVGAPGTVRLDRLLAMPEESTIWRVANVMPVGANVILTAQFKAGKSTLVANLVRSVVEGSEFLARFEAKPARAVALVDFELDERTLRRWLADQHVKYPNAVEVASLRGRVRDFNILDDDVRAAWGAHLRSKEIDLLIVDPLRPLLDALGLDENRETGPLLMAFDQLKLEAGIGELVLVHHAGHGGERSRGDSRLRDWPDVEWRVVREAEDPASPRYFTAFGRDVDVKESRLEWDAAHRRLTLVGGSRADAAQEDALSSIVELLTSSGDCMSGRAIEAAVDGAHPRAAVRRALRTGVDSGVLTMTTGARRAKLYCPGAVR